MTDPTASAGVPSLGTDLFEMIARILPHPSLAARAQASTAMTVMRPAPLPAVASPSLAPAHDAIPDQAVTFIVNEEDGSAAYYARHYEHFDWPGGASGPTIGVGYDLGYVTMKEAIADWTGIVPDDVVTAICRGVGLRGEAAELFVRAHANTVTITFDQGLAQFKQREVPKWLARCRAALPGFDRMPPLCQGVMLSVTYNRGSGGYDDPSPRDAEMRAIKADIAAEKYNAIPMQLLSMRRLWPRGGDLWNRRTHEAALFQKGLTPNGGVTMLTGS